METNKDYMIRTIAGETVLVPVGKAAQKFNGLITLNEVATFIWKQIDLCQNREEIVQKLIAEFEIDEDTAKEDVIGFTNELVKRDMMKL